MSTSDLYRNQRKQYSTVRCESLSCDANATVSGDLTVTQDVQVTGNVNIDGLLSGRPARALIRHVEPSTTQGGSSIVGWNKRTINNIDNGDGLITAIVSSQFNILAGTYHIDITCCCSGSNETKLQLYNLTSVASELESVNYLYPAGTSGSVRLKGDFTSNGTDLYEIRQYFSSGLVNFGFGHPVAEGDEHYLQGEIVKLD